MLGPLGGAEELGGIVASRAELYERSEETAQGGELACHGGGGLTLLGQARRISAQRAVIHRRRLELLLRGPAGELREIDAIGAACLLGGAAAPEVLLEHAERVGPRQRR